MVLCISFKLFGGGKLAVLLLHSCGLFMGSLYFQYNTDYIIREAKNNNNDDDVDCSRLLLE